MRTLCEKPTESAIRKAGELLRDGQPVAIPTETVYGLAANALDGSAVSRVFEAKGRPQDNPLIVHIASLSQLPMLVKKIPPIVYRLAKLFWPGPLTIILPRSDAVPQEVSAGLDTVGIRFPAHPVAQAVIRSAGVPLAAPSANLSGSPSPTNARRVYEDLQGKIPMIIDGGDCKVGVESTVITLEENGVCILRPGEISREQFMEAGIPVRIDPAVEHELAVGAKAASPGMKYKHYAPKANLCIMKGPLEAFRRYVEEKVDDGVFGLVFDGEEELLSVPCLTYGKKNAPEEQAHRLFESLRLLDEQGAKRVFVRCPNRDGVGLAVYNRLLRSAGFEEITLNTPITVGLTGPTGSGKSTVSAAFASQGAQVIDADKVARKVVEPHHPSDCLHQLESAFHDILHPDGTLNRPALAKAAFSSPEQLKSMNDIMNPAIRAEILHIIHTSTADVILLDAPTLLESGCGVFCDIVVSVLAPPEIRLQRILSRDSITKQQAYDRMSAQPDDTFYQKYSNVILQNNGSLQEISDKASALTEEIFRKTKGGVPK